MPEFTLKCLGIGDGWPCGDRNHSSFLYRLGGTSFVIDCGEPVTRQLTAARIAADSIDRIFISHLHCDHIGGFFMLMQGLWLQQRHKRLPVHLPAHGIMPLRQMLDAAYIFDELLDFRLAFEPLIARRPVVTGEARVTAFPTTHLDSLKKTFSGKYPQGFEAFSFLLETDHLRIGHSADIGAAEDLAPLLETPLDLLVCELAHVEPEVLFRYLGGCQIKRILFVHVARNHWEKLEEVRRLAAQTLGSIPFSFARDGEEIRLE